MALTSQSKAKFGGGTDQKWLKGADEVKKSTPEDFVNLFRVLSVYV